MLLTLLIPIVLLVGLTTLDARPAARAADRRGPPGVLALAVMSTAFTGQAIALGFDRRYGVLRRLAATALPRWLLVAGRLVAVLGRGRRPGRRARRRSRWRWAGGPRPAGLGWALLLVLLGCAAFGALGILLGGTLRAEIVLAVANLVWFVLLLAGGIVVPLDRLPGAAAPRSARAAAVRRAGRGAARPPGRPGSAPGSAPVLVLLRLDGRGELLAVRTVKLR